MLSALDRFGFHTHAVTPEYLLTHGKILQIGRMPVQVHIMTSITGVPWQEAWISRDSGAYGGVPVFFIGKTALMCATKALRHAPKIWQMCRRYGARASDKSRVTFATHLFSLCPP